MTNRHRLRSSADAERPHPDPLPCRPVIQPRKCDSPLDRHKEPATLRRESGARYRPSSERAVDDSMAPTRGGVVQGASALSVDRPLASEERIGVRIAADVVASSDARIASTSRVADSERCLPCVELGFEAMLATRDHGLRYLGPTLRGAFGFAFKDLVCQVGHRICERCTMRPTCPYPAIFDGVPPADRSVMRKYPNVPQPWVLVCAGPEEWLGRPDELRFGIRLFGPAARFAPYIVETMLEIGRRGLGPRRVPFELRSVRSDERGLWSAGGGSVVVPPALDATTRNLPTGRILRFRFETPIDLGLDRDEPVDGLRLVLAGRRRLFLLETFYGAVGEHTEVRFPAEAFRTLDARVRPWRIQRYSGRQQRKVPLVGLVGEITIEGPWPHAGRWLTAVERTGIGKHTTFGFGRITWQEVG